MNPDDFTAEQRAEIDATTMEVAHHVIAITSSFDIVMDAVIGCRKRAIEAGFSEMAAEVMATNFYQAMISRMFG